MDQNAAKPLGAVRQFFSGASLLGRGLELVLRSPRLLALGLLPALIAGILYIVALIFLIRFVPDLARFATGFADGWASGLRDLLEVLAGIAIVGVAVLLGMLAFTAVTLAIGDPFYERISELVERRYGGVPDAVEVGFWPSLGRSVIDSIRLITLSIVFGIPLFLLGLVPVAGQIVSPVLGALVGGWLLAVELTGAPFQRRGQRLRDRRRVLRANRPATLGFGVAVFLCFLIPLGAILLMPAAVAGATLLSRRVLGHPTDIVTVQPL
ncbi:EI24 domain-containing protein [Actinoplanes sp. NPDC051343]|uniref:EI24 domain-containing protein n=1 Tax=Actinoplanes sp. NPDC051343 TaxID=3363906 RepID=UPI00379AA181